MSYVKKIWKDIEGFEGLYQVSNYGEIKSLKRFIERNNQTGRWFPKIVLKPKLTKFGYLHAGLSKNGKHFWKPIHRLVGLAFIPNPKNKKQINHKKGNKKDNRAWMLEWNTRLENIQHSYKNGFHKGRKGIIHHNVILSEKDVREIRKNETLTQKEISEKYKIKESYVTQIVNKRKWQHII